MSFRIPGGDQHLPKDIISLFTQLGRVDRLSFQQHDTVKEYEDTRNNHKDIAIEMPAGHGKTLVGGLIGEFNRLTKRWRIVYTCATRQLAYQTTELLNSYGISAVTLVGKSEDFSPADYGKYSRADAIAVTTYSHIFNIKSAFPDGQQIIFDDAHAAEYAIQGFWSVTINRRKYPAQFDALFATLGDSVSKHLQDKILHGTFDPMTDGADIVPQAMWSSKIDSIRTVLDAKVEGTDLFFPWSRIRTNLHACQMYLSHSTITIRPVLPPNLRHTPFAGAYERIYMTATIGNGGELERVFGVPQIHRISKFDAKANKVSGRRLILFPEDHFSAEELGGVLAETIRMQPRALCLCPSESVADEMQGILKAIVPEYTIFKSRDVEDSMTPFTSSPRGILLLHGRYEGIDLKDDDCRLQLFIDLPIGIGLPDKFLQDRIKATEIFNNLLITRVIQGLGRCTRGANDHALVLFMGSKVGKYLYKDEFRRMLPAEIDTEMELGFSQIDHIKSLDSWKSAIQDFYEQNNNPNWQAAEGYIRTETEKKKSNRIESPFNAFFRDAVAHEMNYLYSIWDGEWEKGHRAADAVLSTYKEQSLNGYRAWWNYLMACVGVYQGDFDKARDYHNRAVAASSYKLWLDRRVYDIQVLDAVVYPEPMEIQINSILAKLEKYGDRINRFEKDWKQVLDGLEEKNANSYEPAFRDFGSFLGYETERPTGHGTPDGIWHLAKYWPVFEMKTNIEDPSGLIPLDDIRQTFFHDRYVKQNRSVGPEDEVFIVLICAKKYIPQYASHATEGIFLLEPQVILDMARTLEFILRATLEKLKYSTFEDARRTLGNMLQEKRLDCFNLHEVFRHKRLIDAIQ